MKVISIIFYHHALVDELDVPYDVSPPMLSNKLTSILTRQRIDVSESIVCLMAWNC